MIGGTIGVRYSRNCHPDDLWTKYFTSSKVIQEHREKYGEPDVVEVRQTFNDSLQAREYEHKVLRRLKVIQTERWLNKNPGNGKFYCAGHSEDTKQKMSATRLGKPRSEEMKRKIREFRKRKT